jgi:lysophospholipase L1-like esterase
MVAAFGMAGCGSKAQKTGSKPALAPVVNTPAKNVDRTGWPVIVAFGDSLTAGYGLPADQAFPVRLQAKLKEDHIVAVLLLLDHNIFSARISNRRADCRTENENGHQQGSDVFPHHATNCLSWIY